MEMIFSPSLIFWITAVDIPITGTLFWLIWRLKRDADQSADDMRRLVYTRHSQLRDALAGYKLEVAKSYASNADVRELEKRLVSHLLRIEAKLDRTTENYMKG